VGSLNGAEARLGSNGEARVGSMGGGDARAFNGPRIIQRLGGKRDICSSYTPSLWLPPGPGPQAGWFLPARLAEGWGRAAGGSDRGLERVELGPEGQVRAAGDRARWGLRVRVAARASAG
jgi:hypothetical protein